MIENIHLPSLRNSEFLQFFIDLFKLLSGKDPAALKVQEQEQALRALHTEAEKLFKLKTSVEGTEDLVASDARRDRAIIGINLQTHALTYHFDEEIAQAAKLLIQLLKHYGGGAIARESYVSETALIRNLLRDIEGKEELKAAAEKLQLTAWLEFLGNENETFNDHYVARTSKLGNAPSDSLKDKRTEMAALYKELCTHIAAYHVIRKGAEPFGKTVKELNALIAQYNALLDGRKGRAEEPAENEDTVPAESAEE